MEAAPIRHIRAQSLEGEVSLWDLLTPTRDCVIAPVGPVAASLVEQLGRGGLDQAPVAELTIGGGHKIIGVVETPHLRALLKVGAPLERGDAAIRFRYITVETTLDELLAALSTERALLVMHIEQDEDGPSGEVLGLLAISDLNRHRGAAACVFDDYSAYRSARRRRPGSRLVHSWTVSVGEWASAGLLAACARFVWAGTKPTGHSAAFVSPGSRAPDGQLGMTVRGALALQIRCQIDPAELREQRRELLSPLFVVGDDRLASSKQPTGSDESVRGRMPVLARSVAAWSRHRHVDGENRQMREVREERVSEVWQHAEGATLYRELLVDKSAVPSRGRDITEAREAHAGALFGCWMAVGEAAALERTFDDLKVALERDDVEGLPDPDTFVAPNHDGATRSAPGTRHPRRTGLIADQRDAHKALDSKLK